MKIRKYPTTQEKRLKRCAPLLVARYAQRIIIGLLLGDLTRFFILLTTPNSEVQVVQFHHFRRRVIGFSFWPLFLRGQRFSLVSNYICSFVQNIFCPFSVQSFQCFWNGFDILADIHCFSAGPWCTTKPKGSRLLAEGGDVSHAAFDLTAGVHFHWLLPEIANILAAKMAHWRAQKGFKERPYFGRKAFAHTTEKLTNCFNLAQKMFVEDAPRNKTNSCFFYNWWAGNKSKTTWGRDKSTLDRILQQNLLWTFS